MDIDTQTGLALRGLSKKGVILGKNGCGKSHLLKQIEQDAHIRETFGKVRYISPERGGILEYDPGVDQTISQNPTWMGDQRRRNQSSSFRQVSATLFRRLELLELREIEREHTQEGYVPRTFDSRIQQLNTLLDRVKLERDDARAFLILDKETGEAASPGDISSGEAELISLGIEILAFVKESVADKQNILLIDEPDVHLHPDLQDRLARFMIDALRDQPIILVLATHSTALLAALAEDADTRVAFMRRGDSALDFRPVSDVDRAILPIFGAHPLSNVFNQAPILLVEGEDDERIWQQAVRSSSGRLRLYPCVAGSVERLAAFETEVNNIVSAVYDNATAFSLRDRDTSPELIDDMGKVVRARLSCRASENLMLSDSVLASAGIDWAVMKERLNQWVEVNAEHPYFAEVQAFVTADFPRKTHNLKNIRNVLVGLMSNKPWEVLVGQAIALLVRVGSDDGPDSLRNYLGPKVVERILKLRAT